MLPFTFSLFLALAPVPVDLARLGIDRARELHGRPVVATFIVGAPSDYLLGRTVTGAAEQPDGVERCAVVRGRRWDFEPGKRVEVVGLVRVIEHRGAYVVGDRGPVWVDGWQEVRVEVP